MCSRDGYIWKAWLGGQTHLKPPKFGENLRALSEAIGNPTIVSDKFELWYIIICWYVCTQRWQSSGLAYSIQTNSESHHIEQQ